MAEPDWNRYQQRITRHDPWVDCDGWAEHQTCHDPMIGGADNNEGER